MVFSPAARPSKVLGSGPFKYDIHCLEQMITELFRFDLAV